MKHLIIFIFIFIFQFNNSVYCQKHNHFWISGSEGTPNNDTVRFGGNVFDFTGDTMVSFKELRPMNFYEAMGVGSDSKGNLLFYTNGMHIANIEHDTMAGGGPMNPGYWANEWTSWGNKGYRTRDGIIVVPDISLANHYRLFHICMSDEQLVPDQILTTLVNMEGDNGLGEVITQNKIIYDKDMGRLSQSHFNAVRHANGRDWWLVSILYPSEELMLHLYTPDSIYRLTPQAPQWTKDSGVGQCQFSPDGSKFASGHARKIGENYLSSIHYYTFDRCSGIFTPVFYEVQDDYGISQVGVVFSASSRYLYETYQDYVFRYDTEASDVLASKDTIAEWDGFISYTPGGSGFPVRLGYGELGADDVVYSNSSSTTFYMHKIENADSAENFEVTQHFKVPAIYAWTVPNFPNYQLGPLEGSPCAEMVGPPTALYEYEVAELLVSYEDFSAGVPLKWTWDFGDGAISEQQHPQHTYLNSGTYTVCLTASNIYGGNTQCKDVKVETTSSNLPLPAAILTIQPNPASGQVTIRLPEAEGQVHLYNVSGRVAAETELRAGNATLSLQGLSAGSYMVKVALLDGREVWEKLMIK
jgi:hypothetical protein